MKFDTKNESYGTMHKTDVEKAIIDANNLNEETKIVRKYFQVNKNEYIYKLLHYTYELFHLSDWLFF